MIFFEKTCRLCLNYFEDNLCTPDQRTTEALFFIFKIQVDTNIPFKVCQECNYQLQNFSIFYAKVIDNQSRLWDIVLSQRMNPVPAYPIEMVPLVASEVEISETGLEPAVLAPKPEFAAAVVEYFKPPNDESRELIVVEEMKPQISPTITDKKLMVRKRSQCDICYIWVYNVKQHKKCVHEFLENQTCTICNKTFANRLKLVMHNYYRHTPSKYKCEHCGKTARSPGLLKEHIYQKHMRDAFLYSCKNCTANFNYRTSLVIHEKRLHLEQYLEAKKQRELLRYQPDR